MGGLSCSVIEATGATGHMFGLGTDCDERARVEIESRRTAALVETDGPVGAAG